MVLVAVELDLRGVRMEGGIGAWVGVISVCAAEGGAGAGKNERVG